MMYFTGFRCLGCATLQAPDRDVLLCPECQNLLEATYDYDGIRAHVDRDQIAASRRGVWRWASLLPVLDHGAIVTLGEGDTPMLRCDRLAKAVGVRELWLMSDAANPTGSLKDRSGTPPRMSNPVFANSIPPVSRHPSCSRLASGSPIPRE